MPQYIVIASHDAGQCPGANAKMGEVLQQIVPTLESIGQKHGIKRVAGPLHLDPTHQLLTLLEAPSADAVMDALNENRMMHVQNCQVFRATPLDELMKKSETLGQQPLY
jgi:hypothetical protein